MQIVPTLRRYPVGALFGLVVTGIVTLLTRPFPSRPWLEVPIALICVPGCMLIDRLLDWRFSGKVDARMRHSAAHEDAKIALGKLTEYERQGIINKPDAHKLAGTIAKRDVAGGPRKSRLRGPYHKHRHDDASDSSNSEGPATPLRPAA